MRMRLMFTTALASAAMFAAPALSAGDRVEGTTGMTSPEASAAQLPGDTAAEGGLSQQFEMAGFSGWERPAGAEIFRMQTGAGEHVWVLLMPHGWELAATGPAQPGVQAGTEPEVDAAEMPDIGEQPDIAEAPEQPDLDEPDIAEAPEQPELGEPDIAEAPDVGEPGFVGETEPEGFAARIDDELRSSLEGAGFQQIEGFDEVEMFQTRTEDGRTALVISGDLSAGFGFDGQAPGVAPDMPEPAPEAEPGTGLPQ